MLNFDIENLDIIFAVIVRLLFLQAAISGIPVEHNLAWQMSAHHKQVEVAQAISGGNSGASCWRIGRQIYIAGSGALLWSQLAVCWSMSWRSSCSTGI